MKKKVLVDGKELAVSPRLLTVIHQRFSPVWFSQQEIPKVDIKLMFQAAQLAPSSYNLQPWRYYWAVKGTTGYAKLTDLLADGNNWAKRAPLLILACAIVKTQKYGGNPYALYDLGQATISLCLQAQHLGYFSHQIAGFDKDQAVRLLKLNADIQPSVIIAVGRLGDYTKASQEVLERDNKPRQRRAKIDTQL